MNDKSNTQPIFCSIIFNIRIKTFCWEILDNNQSNQNCQYKSEPSHRFKRNNKRPKMLQWHRFGNHKANCIIHVGKSEIGYSFSFRKQIQICPSDITSIRLNVSNQTCKLKRNHEIKVYRDSYDRAAADFLG